MQELTSLKRERKRFNLREELNFWLLSKSRPCPCPWLGGFKLLIIVEINWGVNREILRCHLGRNGDGACKGTMNQWRNQGFVGSGRGLAQHTANIKHCHNGPKALSTSTHSTPLVQSRSFNKLWYLGQTSAWLCLAKGENYTRQLWQIHVATLTNPCRKFGKSMYQLTTREIHVITLTNPIWTKLKRAETFLYYQYWQIPVTT